MNFRSLLGKTYHPLNSIEVSKSALLSNYRYLSNLGENLEVAPVLKSNAYGHGLVQIANLLDKVNAPFFCVDSIYEAYELLKSGIKTSILIMGYINPENLKVKSLPFSYAVYDKKMVSAISKYQPHADIHVFVDTGMHREGISLASLPSFLEFIQSFGQLRVKGLMSHFAESEEPNSQLTKRQVFNFANAQEMFRKAKIQPKWIHMGNSSAILNSDKYEKNIGNLARAGISLYGIDPEGRDEKLKPVLQMRSTIAQVKRVAKGGMIGYSFTYRAKKDMVIGILPIGYFDGVDRRLSNKGYVKIGNKLCPIVGRVSMNLTSVDLSEVNNPQVGQSVIVYSKSNKSENSILSASNICRTIPYDILVHLTPSTKRIVE